MFSYLWSDNARQETISGYDASYSVKSVMPVLWLEHCLECAMPQCYKSCGMYEDRGDGRCRRFNNGTSLFESPYSPTPGASVEFRRWAKLEAAVRTDKCVSLQEISRAERIFNKVAAIVERPCRWLSWKWHRPSRLIQNYFDQVYIPKRMKALEQNEPVSGLLVVAYNHSSSLKTLHFELKQEGVSLLHTSLPLQPGWNETLYECSLPKRPGPVTYADIYVDNDETAKITFQTLDFVHADNKSTAKPAKKVKCVAWDLDNTMWKGVIGDDGKDSVIPSEQAVDLVKKLDDMGVIQTIVSKNEFDVAWDKIKDLGLAEYFLYPAINWTPKSQNLRGIAEALNINIDTFAVIDDSEFERHEISQALPQVRTYDASEIASLLSRPEFDIPITAESKHRRLSYQTEAKRKTMLSSWNGDYDGFLKDCKIILELFTPTEAADQQRCFELIQRSNQYNITQDRRSEDYIPSIVNNPAYRVFALRVSDKFGHYGIVGFSSFEILDNTYFLRDFVMSCRVAKKSVEKAFFAYIASLLNDGQTISISVEKTDRNNPLRAELKHLGLNLELENATVLNLTYKQGETAPIICDTIKVKA